MTNVEKCDIIVYRKEVKTMNDSKVIKANARLVITVLDSGEVVVKHIFKDKAGTATQQERIEDYNSKIQKAKDYLNN